MLEISGATAAEKLLMKKIERAVMRQLGQRDFFVTQISVVDSDTIKRVNAAERHIDKVTDVLSFPCFEKLSPPVGEDKFSDADRDGKRVMLGDILICRQRAAEQAEELGHSYKRELGFLTCHGLLHLFGFDHVKPEDEEVMTAKQRAIMAAAKLNA